MSAYFLSVLFSDPQISWGLKSPHPPSLTTALNLLEKLAYCLKKRHLWIVLNALVKSAQHIPCHLLIGGAELLCYCALCAIEFLHGLLQKLLPNAAEPFLKGNSYFHVTAFSCDWYLFNLCIVIWIFHEYPATPKKVKQGVYREILHWKQGFSLLQGKTIIIAR